ncbi:hypothetical protein QFC21_001913 [Naganishia friedmannii]|uniref:Uncharacterized protein n=1 Tax=Naganishia friedmannii TaxID=89922 RepID=A0ACC2VZ73_9TREE|nr:hypothetical protein QFC21_001913 [Naganishia friedmannii]
MEGSPELPLNFHNDRAQVMPSEPDTQVVLALQQTDTSRRLASEIEHVQPARLPPTAGAGASPNSDPASVTTPSEPEPSLGGDVPPVEAGVGRESLLEGLRRLIKEEPTLLHQLGVPMITQTVRVKEEKDGPDIKLKLEDLDALAPPRQKVNLGEINLTDIIDSDDEVEDFPQPAHTVGPSSKGKAKAFGGLPTPKEVVPSVGKRKDPREDAISPSSESTPKNDDDGEQVQALGGEGDGAIFTATTADRVKNGRRKTAARADDESAGVGRDKAHRKHLNNGEPVLKVISKLIVVQIEREPLGKAIDLDVGIIKSWLANMGGVVIP